MPEESEASSSQLSQISEEESQQSKSEISSSRQESSVMQEEEKDNGSDLMGARIPNKDDQIDSFIEQELAKVQIKKAGDDLVLVDQELKEREECTENDPATKWI